MNINKIRISILFLTISISIFVSCDFIKDSFTFKDKTKDFVEALMDKDYGKCISQMALENENGKKVNIDTLKLGLEQFRNVIERDFGHDFEYSLMKSEKKRSTVKIENTPPNSTLAYIQFSNKKDFGVFEVLFDDNSKKIRFINKLNYKKPIPNMMLFWLLTILPLTVLVFNIYVIRKIKKSTLPKKWMKYIAILFFNVPTILYTAAEGFSFNLIDFQFLFGVSFNYMGFAGSVWSFGLPLGGIYWLRKLGQYKIDELYDEQNNK